MTDVHQSNTPIRVLLITGQGNRAPDAAYRDWIHTFYPSAIGDILGPDTMLSIVTETSALNAATLAATDVVLNNSLFHQPKPEEFESLFGFVERGGGFFALHAGLVSFLNDKRYIDMIGARFIGHDPVGAFQVEARDNSYEWAAKGCPVHPIAQGLTTFGVVDELYVQQVVRDDLEVVARARFNPVMWVRRHGQGRVAGLALGHDAVAMGNSNFRHLLSRGVQWCAFRELAEDSAFRLR
jgi:uncharacterized protein